jgi:hypothetical protein
LGVAGGGVVVTQGDVALSAVRSARCCRRCWRDWVDRLLGPQFDGHELWPWWERSAIVELPSFVGVVWAWQHPVDLESQCPGDEAVQLGVEVEAGKGGYPQGHGTNPLQKAPRAK